MNEYSKVGLFLVPFLASCSQGEINSAMSVEVKNSAEGGSGEQIVEISLPTQYAQWTLKHNASEWVENSEGRSILLGAVSITPGSSETLELVPPEHFSDVDVQDRAHAELSVRTGGEWQDAAYSADGFTFEDVTSFTSPPQLTDHSYFLRFEGPGWESDQIGYRLYLDWRNAIDVFVKTTDSVVLPNVGQDGYDSYHNLSSWGGDALKVGKSLGVGALGRLVEKEAQVSKKASSETPSKQTVMHFQHVDNTHYQMVSNSKLRAEFDVIYQGWSSSEVKADSIDITTRYRIDAFDPTTHINVTVSEPTKNIVAGLVAHDGMQVIKAEQGEWGVVATWGEQSILADNDRLGLALFYRIDQVEKVFEGEHDHLVLFKPLTTLDYKILAVWPKRISDVQTAEHFKAYLVNKLKVYISPPVVVIKKV